MEYVSDIINRIIANFDFSYMLSVNVLTYLLIKVLDNLNGDKPVSRLNKKLILVFSIVIVASIYYFSNFDNTIKLINSSILAPVFWSWVLKPIIKKFGIDYKEIDSTIN